METDLSEFLIGVGLNADDVKNLNPAQIDAAQTILRQTMRSPSMLMQCSGCNRKFKIANFKQSHVYKCNSCGGILSEVKEEIVQSVAGTDIIVKFDEALPADVTAGFKNSENIFGRYVLVAKVGEGAMGAVWKAFDIELMRYVALKFIKSKQLEELRYEARLLASLEHTNITRVYDVGIARDQGYIAMEFVTGKALSEKKFEVETAFEIMRAVCDGVAYAHEKGVIHRDIKPENIMLQPYGIPKVMDFGLGAKGTTAGEIAGTPGYIAPEILSGESASKQSDVYAIGATLYTLLSGISPHSPNERESIIAYFERVKVQEPVPLDDEIPEDARAIITKAMQKTPASRYSDAAEIGKDIDRYLRGLPVKAMGGGAGYVLKKLLRRNMLVAAISAAFVVIAGTLGYVGISKWQDAQREEKQRVEAVKQREETENQMKMVIEAFVGSCSEASTQALLARKGGATQEQLKSHLSVVLPLYNQLIQKGIKNAAVHHSLGVLYRIVGDEPSALQQQKFAAAIDADDPSVHFELASIKYRIYFRNILAKRRDWREHESRRRFEESGGRPTADDLELPSIRELETPLLALLRKEWTAHYEKASTSSKRGSSENVTAAAVLAALHGRKGEGMEQLVKLATADEPAEEAVTHVISMFEIDGNVQGAIGVLKHAISMDKGNVTFRLAFDEFLFFMGGARELQGIDPIDDYREVLKETDETIRLAPKIPDSFVLRGRVLGSIGLHEKRKGGDPSANYGKAIENFDSAIALDEKGVSARLYRGQTMVNLGLYRTDHGLPAKEIYETAIAEYGRVLKIDPKLADGWICMGVAKNNLGQAIRRDGRDPTETYSGAIKDFNEAISIDDSENEAWMRRGMAYGNIANYKRSVRKDASDDYRKSTADLEKATALNPNYSDGFVNLGYAHLNFGIDYHEGGGDPEKEYSAAVSAFEAATRINDLNFRAWVGLAHVQTNLAILDGQRREDPGDHYRKVIAAYDETLQIEPNDYEALVGRGNTRGALMLAIKDGAAKGNSAGLYEGLVADFEKAMQIDPKNPEAYLRRGMGHYFADHFKEALADFDKADSLSPGICDECADLWKDARERSRGDY